MTPIITYRLPDWYNGETMFTHIDCIQFEFLFKAEDDLPTLLETDQFKCFRNVKAEVSQPLLHMTFMI
jgi:hypothetical protein